MPYAKVGAMPQPQNDNHPPQQSRKGRPQGITMEDLKKQTAIRLANEPENPALQCDPIERNMQIHDLKRQTAIRLAKEQEQSRVAGQPIEGGMQILPPEHSQMQYQHVYAPPQAFTPVDPNRVVRDPRMFEAPPMDNPSFSRYEGQPMVDTKPNNQMQYPQGRNTPTPVPHQPQQQLGTGRGSPRNSRPNRPGSSLSTGSVNSFGSADPKGGKAKPKLPHGLTVQELKEMTKARLQAEASEGTLDSDAQPADEVREVLPQQPYGRGAGEAISPLGFVHEPGKPAGFQGMDRLSPHTPTTPTWQQQSSGLDGWETGSVASSEYLGSESAYSSGFQHQDDHSGVPFSRSRSYGASGYEQPESRSPYLPSSSPYSDLSAGQNRRRACTLSPRPGPGLTYLHEDRPLGNAHTNVGLPSFDSATRPRPRGRNVNPDVFNNDASSLNSSPARFWAGTSGNATGGDLSNRPRTASAPTVRSVSQPSDEFLTRGNDPLARLPSTHSLGVGVEPSRDRLITAFDSALGLSSGGGGNGNDFNNSVFRQPTGVQRPPPGLFPNSEPSTPGLLGSRSNDLSWDEGGWGKPSIGSRNHQYQSRERSHTDGEALLADSLGSMLNISVPQRESATRQPSLGNNTFVSRIDPEVDFNRRRAATSSPLSPSLREALSAPNSTFLERGGNGAFRDDTFRDDTPSYL